MSKKNIPGDVFAFKLSNSKLAYARLLEDSAMAFYAGLFNEDSQPPIGERIFQFTVGVYADVLNNERVTKVGHDPAGADEEDLWPPPASITDDFTGKVCIYHRGQIIEVEDPVSARDLEPAAVWDLHHLEDRLLGDDRWS